MRLTESYIRGIIRKEIRNVLKEAYGQTKKSVVDENLDYVMDELGKIAEINGMEEIPSYLASTVQLAYDPVAVARLGKGATSDDLKELAKGLTPLGIILNLSTAPNLKPPEGYTVQNRKLAPTAYFSSINNVPPQLVNQYVNNERGLHSNQNFGTVTVRAPRRIQQGPGVPNAGMSGQYGTANTALASGYKPSTIRANPGANAGR
jgi:hypothetical protein